MAPYSLDELRAFVAVADARSFTGAARRLGVTTNAVSLRVQRLEAALGVRLFVRTTRSVAATDEGNAFHERVSRILGELDVAESDLRPDAAGLRGTVRIAIPGAVASGPFLERLRDLLELHPMLTVQTRVTNVPASPATEGLDIALVVGQLPESTFVGRLLGRASWVLASRAEGIAPADVDQVVDDFYIDFHVVRRDDHTHEELTLLFDQQFETKITRSPSLCR